MTPARRISKDAVSLWFEAPFVIAIRMQQMQMAALTGNTKVLTEMNRMVTEKMAAAAESAVAVNVALSKEVFHAATRAATSGATAARSKKSQQKILSEALKPYGKRVRSNARRLSRDKS
ncbi:hypothetical protein MRS76_16775 [Rhizobiaceae bacterium n13]|uniref:Phasin domain-containing protein n=1 Tax=Ferirhizobium litorale TaxID=2927786 RepID=A0AAE3QCX1_9HYPH|nr:hypothetical protein [Fererhizobium litorale]MDI7863612.1 hypothetical protein [Fererhizobium litorale]MDI7923467.1 hypothetical protein [Fererhizobium litorale]